MEKINICLTSPSKNAYSETFIYNLKGIIDGNIFHCFGGIFPIESEDNELKNPSLAPIFIKLFSRLGLIKKPIRELYLENYLIRKKIQLIIANYGPSGVELSNVSKRLKIPLIVHFHGYDASVDYVLQQYLVSYQDLFKIAKAIVVVSFEMKNRLIDFGAKEEKIVLLRCSPSPLFNSINPNFNSNQVLCIGRFVEKKAPYLTLLAFQLAQIRFPDIRIKFIGDGDLLGVCKDLSQSLKLKNVEFSGAMSPDAIRIEMANSFCFVQHSKTASNGDKEGTPVAILEAMAAGLPVISTYHAGISEVVSNEVNGILVDELDVDGMSKALERLYENRKMAKILGQRGKEFILEKMNHRTYKSNWNQLVQDVIIGK